MLINEAIGCALSKSIIKPATWVDICRVAKAMKPDHRRTACALSGTAEPLEAIRGLEHSRFVGVTIWRDGEPIVACGAVLEPQNGASTFLFATDRWPEVVSETERFIRKSLRKVLSAAGVHQVKTVVGVQDPLGGRWKRLLGSRLGELIGLRWKNLGPKPAALFRQNGESFFLFVCHLRPSTISVPIKSRASLASLITKFSHV